MDRGNTVGFDELKKERILMAKKKLRNKLIPFSEIKEELGIIEGSDTDFVTPTGQIYKLYDEKENLYLHKKLYVNKHNGYVYCGISMREGKNKSHRVHKLVAKAFIPKAEGCDIVGHKDNNKSNNVVSNLYWTTVQENTQKAFDDGLAKNKKGYEDSQSNPVIVYDSDFNEIARYGSMRECSRKMNVGVNTISNHCKGKTRKAKKGFYYRFDFEAKKKISSSSSLTTIESISRKKNS